MKEKISSFLSIFKNCKLQFEYLWESFKVTVFEKLAALSQKGKQVDSFILSKDFNRFVNKLLSMDYLVLTNSEYSQMFREAGLNFFQKNFLDLRLANCAYFKALQRRFGKYILAVKRKSNCKESSNLS